MIDIIWQSAYYDFTYIFGIESRPIRNIGYNLISDAATAAGTERKQQLTLKSYTHVEVKMRTKLLVIILASGKNEPSTTITWYAVLGIFLRKTRVYDR